MILINGKEISAELRQKLKTEVAALEDKGVTPGLAVIMVGENEASKVYVRNKQADCTEVGIYSSLYHLPQETTTDELIALIETLNGDFAIDGILVQLPVPAHIDEKRALSSISPDKDVDGFHPQNIGALTLGAPSLLPCTPYGVIKLLEAMEIPIEGKECVIIGRSNIVGKPMALLMLQKNATVTVCHSKTKNIKKVVKRADIVIAAIGQPKFVTEDMIKDGAVVIDVGINKQDNGKLCGDVDFDAVAEKTSYITPVPGGVGPMTRAMLLKNTVAAAVLHSKL